MKSLRCVKLSETLPTTITQLSLSILSISPNHLSLPLQITVQYFTYTTYSLLYSYMIKDNTVYTSESTHTIFLTIYCYNITNLLKQILFALNCFYFTCWRTEYGLYGRLDAVVLVTDEVPSFCLISVAGILLKEKEFNGQRVKSVIDTYPTKY